MQLHSTTVGTRSHGGNGTKADARERAQGIRSQVSDEVVDVIETAERPLGDVYVGWTAAVDAATCPVKYRAAGEHGWEFPGWSPSLAASRVGRAALAHHLRGHDQPGNLHGANPPPLPDPVGCVRAWLRAASKGESRPPVGAWIADLAKAGDKAALAATAAYASRWVGGFVRMLGWPLPERLGIVADDMHNPFSLRWTPKSYRIEHGGAVVTIASSPDAVLGGISPAGDHALVVHRPVGRSDTELADRAAFEGAAASLTIGVVPAKVILTTGDTGEKLHFPVDAALLDHGAREIVEVVRQRALAASAPKAATATETGDTDTATGTSEKGITTPAGDTDDATPSTACHYCDNLDRCPPGQAWVHGPGRWVGGLPAT